MERIAWTSLLALGLSVLASEARARPVAPAIFCDTYPEAPACLGGQLAACLTCHTQAGTKAMNAFGVDVGTALATFTSSPYSDADFTAHLASALIAIEEGDSDKDGYSNFDEITKGSYPGLATSIPSEPQCPDDPSRYPYTFCQYDFDFALQRIAIDFCGRRASYLEVLQLSYQEDAGKRELLHKKLDTCLDSEFWRGKTGQVAALANRKIRPVAGLEVFAPFEPDYALFVYANTDDRNVQDLLLADYNVAAVVDNATTSYAPIADPDGFPLQVERRAGLLTSPWMLFYNTMFTAVPRSTAAQAYRAYLNLDIALQEGLTYYAPEPIDWDGAGITEAECYTCHKTIEAMVGPFSRYNGLTAGNGTTFYQYDANRMQTFAFSYPNAVNLPENGYVLGQPVDDLVAWANVAANSDEFFQAVTEDYWKLLIGRPPSPEDPASFTEYSTLWQSLESDPGHRVELMLHALVDTEAYGAP